MKTLSMAKAREILLALQEQGPLKFNEIKKIIGGDPKTASRRLKYLHQYALVSRSVQQDAWRTVIYSITPKGEKALGLIGEFQKLEKE